MSRRVRREYPRRRRHRRHVSGGRRSPLVWLALACLFLLIGLWFCTVLRFTSGVGSERNEQEFFTDPSKEWWKKRGVLPSVAGDASETHNDQKPPNRSSSRNGKPLVLHTIYSNVDYKGGDIQGPADADNPEACRLLCVRNGRCLKWTLQEKEGICWLKDEGGTRIEDVAGVTSGIVRTDEDKTIPKATDEREVLPPPVCCPEGAAVPRPGVHPLDLWDDEPASDWTTTYALGNGRLGAMLAMGTFQENIFLSDGSLWAGKGKVAEKGATDSSFPRSPDRYQEFQRAREALLDGDVVTAQERAGRMPTRPDGFVGSFEYAGELHLDFGGGSAGGQKAEGRRERVVDGYIRHLHLNNGTAEVMFGSRESPAAATDGDAAETVPIEQQQHHHHYREAFASNVDGVLAMRLSCEDRNSGRGCLSVSITPNREGDSRSHLTEAWQLPPPRARRRDDAAADGPDEGKVGEGHLAPGGSAGGAYVGLFRPPGGSGKTPEMGFHMCVAVIPMDEGGGAGAVAEEYMDERSPSQGRRPGGARAQEKHDDLERARLEDRPGVPPRRKLSKSAETPRMESTRHRIVLSNDKDHVEAVVLLSVVTEGEPETNEEKERAKGEPYRDASHAGSAEIRIDKGPRGREDQDGGSFGQRQAGWASRRDETDGVVDDVDGVQEAGGSETRRVEAFAGGKLGDGAPSDKGGWKQEDEDKRMRRRCLDRLEAAAALGFEKLRGRHANDFRALSERVHFSLGPSSSDNGSGAAVDAGVSAGSRNGQDGAGGGSRKDGSGSMEASLSGSCVAGLPIRTRVSRSGKACTEEGGGGAVNGGGDLVDRTVLDDGLIELMYHYGRYLVISGSRPGGRPLNLQGIWANSLKAKWEGDYHMNINLQMNYWGTHAAGLSECAAPLVGFVERLSDGGRQTAHSYYHAAGWVSHANTDRWGGTAAHGDAVWALCPTCGAWMALHLWEAFEYTGDVSLLLSSVVPVMEGAVTFFLDYMVLADDGLGDGTCLLTGPSTSPENSLPAVKNVLKNGLPPPEAEEQHDAPPKAKGPQTPAKKKAPPEVLFPFVAMSPAIDVAIVRQLFENFLDASREVVSRLPLLEQGGSPSLSGLPAEWTTEQAPRLFNPPGPWREEEKQEDSPPGSADRGTEMRPQQPISTVSERLRRLSERAEEALLRLPNSGRPYIGKDGMVREYRGVDTSRLPDPGHRHFSGLWALYPGQQLSPDQGEDEFEAAAATVQYKVEKGGGHTSWSRAWLANLRARLFQGSEALDSLRGLLRDQCVGSLFSLHPALTRTLGKEMAECTSCFEMRAEDRRPSSKKQQLRPAASGLVTRDGSAFQIDGNLGFLAGVNEMLLQSRLRYSKRNALEVRLLPALPEDWQDGRFRGLRARGGYEVDVEWNRGEIDTASLRPVPNSPHVVGDERGGLHGALDSKAPSVRVLSRTQLVAVLVVDGKKMASDVGILLDEEETLLEGGVLWFCVGVKALRPGEEVHLYSIGA
ncbi:unnamed protein product [Scytosiphon promiscuus]